MLHVFLVRLESLAHLEGIAANIALEGFFIRVPHPMHPHGHPVFEPGLTQVTGERPVIQVPDHVVTDGLLGVKAFGAIGASKMARVLVLGQVVPQQLLVMQQLVAQRARQRGQALLV